MRFIQSYSGGRGSSWMITGGEPARSHRASLALGICPSRTGTTTRPTAVVPGSTFTCMRPVQLAVTHTRPGDWPLDQGPRGCEREDSPVPPPSAIRHSHMFSQSPLPQASTASNPGHHRAENCSRPHRAERINLARSDHCATAAHPDLHGHMAS